MRQWIDLFESTAPLILYHGTKSALLPMIQQHGLTAETDTSWQEFGPGIYLSDQIESAENYGDVVLAIDVSMLDPRNMVPDDYELRDFFDGAMEQPVDQALAELGYDPDTAPSGIYEASWLDSLRICHQCQYLGDIPPAAIRVAKPNTPGPRVQFL